MLEPFCKSLKQIFNYLKKIIWKKEKLFERFIVWGSFQISVKNVFATSPFSDRERLLQQRKVLKAMRMTIPAQGVILHSPLIRGTEKSNQDFLCRCVWLPFKSWVYSSWSDPGGSALSSGLVLFLCLKVHRHIVHIIPLSKVGWSQAHYTVQPLPTRVTPPGEERRVKTFSCHLWFFPSCHLLFQI